jgi:hypothetical protein
VKVFTRLFIALLATGGAMSLSAQNEVDALRYSFREPLGSARFMAMGGAFGALGGDMSSMTWNPAGLGVYRRNDLGVTMGISGFNTDAIYNDAQTPGSDFSFHLPSAGLAVANRTEDPDWMFFNYGVAFNKVVNFNRSYTVHGPVNNTTLLDVFATQANGTHYDDLTTFFPFGAGLAWNTFLLDTIGTTTDQYQTQIPFGRAQQEMTVTTSGHMSETAVALGTNYRNQLFLGATVGFPTVRFTQTTTYREFDLDPSLILEDFTYTDNLVTTGSGINIKLGAIYRASKWLRLGAAWHSRTTLRLNDVWDTRMIANYTGFGSFDDSRPGAFDYRISIPSRTILSAAFFLGRDGVISADYEFVDYSSAELRPSAFQPGGYNFQDENRAVSTLFRPAHNVRIGAEWRLQQVFRARAGMVFQQDPYIAEATSLNSHLLTYSVGGGYRSSKYYVEFAYALRFANEEFYLYDPALVNAAELRGRKGELMFTVGLRY